MDVESLYDSKRTDELEVKHGSYSPSRPLTSKDQLKVVPFNTIVPRFNKEFSGGYTPEEIGPGYYQF